MKKYYANLIIILLIITYLTVTVNGAFELKNNGKIKTAYKNNNLLRLHIIAESNSPLDQSNKRNIRNKFIHFLQDNKDLSNNNYKNIIHEKTLNKFLENLNIKEECNVNYGNYKFPRRTYGNLTLEPGNYNTVQIKIGDGQGSNWWCVLVPSLCIGNNDMKTFASKNEVEYKSRIYELIK